MKKFKNVIPDGGFKFFNKYIETQLSDEIWEAMQAVIADFSAETEGFVLIGGTVTGSSPNAQITDSIVVLNEKILRLPATTGQTYPFYLQEAAATTENGDFEDAVARPVIDVEIAETSSSIPGAGQYITIAAAGEYKKGSRSRRIVEDNGASLRTKVIDIGDWDMDATSSVNVTHGISSLETKIRGVSIVIKADVGDIFDLRTNLERESGAYWDLNTFTGYTEIVLSRVAAGYFDNTNFADTSYNRGWITIQYEE